MRDMQSWNYNNSVCVTDIFDFDLNISSIETFLVIYVRASSMTWGFLICSGVNFHNNFKINCYENIAKTKSPLIFSWTAFDYGRHRLIYLRFISTQCLSPRSFIGDGRVWPLSKAFSSTSWRLSMGLRSGLCGRSQSLWVPFTLCMWKCSYFHYQTEPFQTEFYVLIFFHLASPNVLSDLRSRSFWFFFPATFLDGGSPPSFQLFMICWTVPNPILVVPAIPLSVFSANHLTLLKQTSIFSMTTGCLFDMVV